MFYCGPSQAFQEALLEETTPG